jgi:ATP-dependent DNA helicase RecQ
MSDPDIAWRFRLIANEIDLDAEQALRRREMLRAMIGYAESSACRHDGILRHFEDEAEALGGCGHCDNCRALAAGTLGAEPDEAASAETVKAALSAIRGLPFAAGAGAIASYLIGNPSRQITGYEWEKRKEFGLLRERSEDWTKRLLRRLVAGGLLHIDPERPTLHLTRRAADVISGARPNAVRLPPDASPVAAGVRRVSSGAKMLVPAAGSMDGAASALFERLRAWREELAKKMNVPAYAILNDASLRAISVARPQSDDELMAIPGIGPAKLERHGADLRRIVGEAGPADGVPVMFAKDGEAASDSSARSWHEERVAEARKLHPRAYEPWTDDEDARLRALVEEGRTIDEVSSALQRQPNAVRIRAERLGVVVDAAAAPA